MKLIDYVSLANKIKNETKDDASHKKIKIYVLRSFTCEIIESILTVELYNEGYLPEICFGGYNQFMQEALDANSELYSFLPDIVLLCVRIEDFYPLILESSQHESMSSHIEAVCKYIFDVVEKINSRLNTSIIINSFVKPSNAPMGVIKQHSFDNILNEINYKIYKHIESIKNVSVASILDIFLQLGIQSCYDFKMWHISKNPYTLDFYKKLSAKYAEHINAIYGKRKKCIVLDLDNTLWDGILGEVGINGIVINSDFQKQLLNLKQSGILLAINSKNNISDVEPVFEQHPEMILKLSDIAALRVNWEDKATNMKSIAAELNIGTDSIVFIDDSIVECELVKKFLPDVDVYCLPQQKYLYAEFLKTIKNLNTMYLTEEDVQKTQMYKSQQQRKILEQQSIDIEAYLIGLGMTATIESLNDFNIARVAQLTQKTNQFNVTTKRFTEEELKNIDCKIYVLSLSDKFGDSGITGAAFIRCGQNSWHIENILMSCRIMGRNVEYAFMSFIFEQAKVNGIETITGKYIATTKNIPVKDLYRNMGFSQLGDEWTKKVSLGVDAPKYIEIRCLA